MTTFSGLADARDAAQDFYYANRSELPQHVEEKLAPQFRTGTSPVDALVNTTEILFANADVLGADARALGADLAQLRDNLGFHLDQEPARARNMITALRRPGKFKFEESDPKPLEQYLAPPPPTEEAAAPADGEGA